MATEDSLDIFGSDPFGRDYLYGLSTGRDGQGLAPYGTRYAENLSQPTTAKGRGYLGNVGTMQDPMTELSASSDFGGRTVRYPLIVPTLTADELNLLRSGGEPTQEIYGKAQQYALGRLSRGQDPFATTQDLRYPQPQAVDTRPYDQMQATPRGFTSGLFSDVLGRTLNMPSLPRTGIPALDLLSPNMNLLNRLSFGDLQKTTDRISYGEPLSTGSGMTLRPKDETINAAMNVAPFAPAVGRLANRAVRATEGMPVGMSIKDVGSNFNVVKRDASDIFGAGSERVRYTEPKSGGSIEVVSKPDGSASILSLEVPEKFRGKKIGESLQAQVMQDFPEFGGQFSSKAAAKGAYRLGLRPLSQPNATFDDVLKMIDEDSSVNMVTPQMQSRFTQPLPVPQKTTFTDPFANTIGSSIR